MERDDPQLIADYVNGDESALPLLINRHLKAVYHFVYQLLGSATDAEDVTQETFFKAWKHLKKYRTDWRFRTWLFAIAKNTSTDFLRKQRSISFSEFERGEGESVLETTLADSEPLPDELLARAEDKKLLVKLLGKLSPLYRAVLLLRYDEELTFDEIGKVLGKPLHTVKSQHRRALIELRTLIEAAPKGGFASYI